MKNQLIKYFKLNLFQKTFFSVSNLYKSNNNEDIKIRLNT